MKKRDDLQGLRGIAIAAVFLFHCRQDLFSNGYLGVDVFFVLSGFLISSILSKHGKIGKNELIDFYQRRFKRIVPLYATMLLACVVASFFLFLPIDIVRELPSFLWSMAFSRNLQQMVDARDYWKQASDNSKSLLLHCWSLGVEIQYYLAAPFIMAALLRLHSSRRRMIALLVMITASLLVYLLSDTTAQFNSPLCRVWQFLLGSLAAEISKAKAPRPTPADHQDKEALLETSEEDNCEKVGYSAMQSTLHWYHSTVCSLFLLFVLLLPIRLEITPVRIGISLLVTNLIANGGKCDSPLLINAPLVYLGDISYALYLSHWPVIVFHGYHMGVSSVASWESFFTVLSLTMALTILTHHTLEKCSMKVGFLPSAAYVAVLYAVLSLLLHRSSSIADALMSNRIDDYLRMQTTRKMPEVGEWRPDMNFTAAQIKEIIRYNQGGALLPIPPHDKDEQARKWTNYTDEKEHNDYSFIWHGKGNLSILLLGNSFAWRASPVIHDVFAGHYSELRVYTHLGCRILTDTDCEKFRRAYKIVLEKQQPDITLMIARDPNFLMNNSIPEAITKRSEERVAEMIASSKRLVVDGQNTFCGPQLKLKTGEDIETPTEIARRLQAGRMDMSELWWSRQKSDAYHILETTILTKIAAGNRNITFNSVYDQYCLKEEGVCPFFNPKNLHSFYGDKWGHLILEGLNGLRAGYKAIAERLVKELYGKATPN